MAIGVLLSGLLTLPVPAMAYWHQAGSGTGTATTGALSAPVAILVPTISGADVPISWTASTGAVIPIGYVVTRSAIESSPEAACGSSIDSLIASASCVDESVGDGTYAYTVTAVYRTWHATSEPSGGVAVLTATQLAFTTQPSNSHAGAVLVPPVQVTVESANGLPVPTAGILIAVSISFNPGGGTLSGPTSILTDADGVATFDSLAIDQPGVNYLLGATSPGLSAVTSAPFAVTGGPALGAAASFSVLGGVGGVISTGTSTLSGDLGVSPSSAITGFAPGTVAGNIYAGDITAANGQAALTHAYNEAKALTADTTFSGDQNGLTFTAGVHYTAEAFALTGSLTLDGGGDPNSIFIFQVDAALNTAAASHLLLVNGAKAANVFWQVNGAAGTGGASTFSGTILANGAITIGAGTQLIGRALGMAAVTLADNTIRFTAAPAPSIAIDGGIAAVTKVDAPAITGTTAAAVGRTVTVTVGSQVLSTAVQTDHTWAVAATSLAAGTYGVVARVRDAAGNAGWASQQLTVQLNPPTVALGTAASYSVLGGTGIAGSGISTLSGDLGVSPGGAITGFPLGTVGGSIHLADSNAADAATALAAAYDDAAGRTAETEFSGDQIGAVFHAGVHHSAAAFALTGILTLDGENYPDAIFIIQVDAALNTAASSSILLINGAQAKNVFWQVSGAASTGATSTFSGTILANGAITIGAGAELIGRALSMGTVTLADNTVRFTA
jgi:hypothetical protein